ncbi:ATP-dependent helicase HrpB [Parathalassolituus penaei]|uniref:ATP-dependent helicase HrpB n=1 Tax=Parathalassolituus penaei TaxID=2997323 RepID=A0A9X3IR74_9GAMM|nr:ATP-dependent helicase HrpB [Parathalassolituus penaei]MCY0964566.1 ATP-dependent helicase HrpB [Parathalassolituus penaei]
MTDSTNAIPLPIDAMLDDIRQQLAQHPNLLLTAEPGAGKTTRVPLALMDADWLDGQQILLLEPRRLAARNAALFMARQLGEAVGERVGYRIRLEQKSSARTRILVITEGILTRMLQTDPELTGVGLILFDEFHERHLQSDLALALAHQSQQLLRPDLRLLVMSATLDTDSLSAALDAPALHCPGRGFPVVTHYRPARNSNERLAEQLSRVLREALNEPIPTGSPGHVLMFLPGTGDIRRLQELLTEQQQQGQLPAQLAILPLHGQLDDSAQKAALAPAPEGVRKVLLATNIAESSLTLDGVALVIDSGLERRMEFSPASGLSELQTRNISQASATQREGRAGRQCPGLCYRLWSEGEHSRRPAHISPEIAQQDLSSLLLELLTWGAAADELLWLTPPPAPALAQASDLLQQLGISDGQQLTDHGRQCAAAGLEPRWAHALLLSGRYGMGRAASELVALIQDGPRNPGHQDDLDQRLHYARQQGFWRSRIQPLAQRWADALNLPPRDSSPLQPALIAALAFPDRIARLRAPSGSGNSRYQLANGSGAELGQDSRLNDSPWLAIAEMTGGNPNRIRLAVALDDQQLAQLQEWQPHLFREVLDIRWLDNGTLLTEQQQRLGKLVWKARKLASPQPEQWLSIWKNWMADNPQQALECLDWQDSSRQLQARMVLVYEYLQGFPTDSQQHMQFSKWPDCRNEALAQRLYAVLEPWLDKVRNQRDLARLDWFDILKQQLDWEQQQLLDQLAPLTIKVPSGSRITLDYCQEAPVLAVKLQEMFGSTRHPTILDGRLPVLVHLLSPARRPVQITRDLPGFWSNSYAEVRKDLRGRYPKHPWPEDPTGAEATALTSNALARQKQSGQ